MQGVARRSLLLYAVHPYVAFYRRHCLLPPKHALSTALLACSCSCKWLCSKHHLAPCQPKYVTACCATHRRCLADASAAPCSSDSPESGSTCTPRTPPASAAAAALSLTLPASPPCQSCCSRSAASARPRLKLLLLPARPPSTPCEGWRPTDSSDCSSSSQPSLSSSLCSIGGCSSGSCCEGAEVRKKLCWLPGVSAMRMQEGRQQWQSGQAGE